MKLRTLACLLALALTGPLTGCREESTPNAATPPANEPISELDRLRSLPYLGFAAEKAEDRHGVVRLNRQRSYPGYNLYTNRNLCLAELIDARGRVVQSWTHPGCHHWTHCELLPNGDLLVGGMDMPDRRKERRAYLSALYLLRLSWTGEVVWKWRIPVHHDAELTPRNQILALTIHDRHLPDVDPRIPVQDNSLSLLSLDGVLLQELSLYDLFTAGGFPLQKVEAAKTMGQRDIDLFHANSVEWMHHPHLEGRHPIYAAGNVLISSRHQDTIAVVDWDEGRLLWTWGRGEISGPHDATVLASGNILIFDNGLNRRWSRVIELDPIREQIVWEFRPPDPDDFFTAARGGNQRLPNGNTLIANSDSGQAFEVTHRGEVVWEFLNPHLNSDGHRATIIRMNRYETAFIDDLLARHESR